MSIQKRFLETKKAYQVTFSFPKSAANGAKKVKLLGDFNNWEKSKAIPMKLKKDEFTAVMELAPGQEVQFRYLLDDTQWENDPAADKYVGTPFGVENSVVVIEK